MDGDIQVILILGDGVRLKKSQRIGKIVDLDQLGKHPSRAFVKFEDGSGNWFHIEELELVRSATMEEWGEFHKRVFKL